MMDQKSANGLSSKAGEGGGQRKQLPYSVETPYGFHLDLDFLKYVDDIEKGNTIKRVHIHRRARGPKFSTLPRNFSLPGHGARPAPRDTWSGTSTLGPKPKSRVTEVQQIFDFRPSDGRVSSQSRVQGGSYASARPKEEAGAGAQVFDEGLQGRPNLLRTSSMPVTIQHRKGSDSGDDRPPNAENGSSENVFRAADVMDRRCLPQDRTGLHQQITVALKRVRELEEQVRTIPELKAQICSLREEREQLLLRLQAQALAAGPSPPWSTDPGSDAEPPGAGATGQPGLTSAGGMSEKQRSTEDQSGLAGRETLHKSADTSVVRSDAAIVLAQESEQQAQTEGLERQTEVVGSLSEKVAEKLSGDGAALKAPDASESVVLAGNTDSISKAREDLGSVQQLQGKLVALEAKLTQAGRNLDNTNALLREQVEENQRKEERIQQLSEEVREEASAERETAGRRESVDRDMETETVDIADRETETERANTADQGTDTETIVVLVSAPRERANSVDRGTEMERLDMQDQLTETETEMVGAYVGRGRANSVDQETETERVDTVDQVTETQPADRVDQVTETETNTPVRPRADSVDRGTETERVDTVDQVTETEGMGSADQQTETVRERHERQNSNPGDTVEFSSMVTGTFLTESVVIESMDTERAASVFEDSMAVASVVTDVELAVSPTPLEESVVTDVELAESSTPEERVVTDVDVKEVSALEESAVTCVELKESPTPEESVVTDVELKLTSTPEQSVASEIEVRESMFTEQVVTEQLPPERAVAEFVVTEDLVTEIVVMENVVLETVQSTVVEGEAAREAVPESVITDKLAAKAEAPESPTAGTGPAEPEQKEPEQPQAQSQPQAQAQAQAQAQTQVQPQDQTQAQAQAQAPPQRPHRALSEAQTQPARRAFGDSPPPPHSSGEASISQPPRLGSGDSPASPAALGQVVTRLTGLLNEQWAQLGSGGQQGGGQQYQDAPGAQKPAAKSAAKPAGRPVGKAGPSKMSSIQSQLVSSLSALSAFYSPGQKAQASKQQGLKSIMKKNEGADKGNGGAKKNLKFVGVNGGYETTSSEESSGEDNAPEEEVDSSDAEDQQPEQEEKEEAQEVIQEGAPQGEDPGPGAQGGGAQGGETEGRAESHDPESSQELQEEQAAGETVNKDFMEACHYIKDHMGEVTTPDKDMRQVLLVLYQEWFRVSSQKDSLADTVTLYLRAVGVATPTLLRYIVNLADGNGNTALHYSVSHSNFPVVRLLLDTGLCEVNTQNKAGYTAVMLASLTAADGSEDMEVALQLLRQGDVNARASQAGQTALMLAVSHGRTAMVRLLLSCQADVNVQDRHGTTALMSACELGHAHIARLLLASTCCDVGLADKDGQTALSLAVQASHNEIVDLLKANSDASASGPPTTTAQ